jgi:hypothetical protein
LKVHKLSNIMKQGYPEPVPGPVLYVQWRAPQ